MFANNRNWPSEVQRTSATPNVIDGSTQMTGDNANSIHSQPFEKKQADDIEIREENGAISSNRVASIDSNDAKYPQS